ncbi:hypothetical protein ACTFR8_24240 [Bacillus cereus group sp. MYBK15-3]|uniref:hypothetical protein n=1 Tax=unclassified Bacillus cereus group TaxID=2750818 RepID=UPI003F79006A
MMDLRTGCTTKKGEWVRIGDILSSPNTHDVVVVVDIEGTLFAQIKHEPSMAFELEYFLRQHSDLTITGSVVARSKKKIFEDEEM